MKPAQRIWSPVCLFWPGYMAPALRMVSPVREHNPVRAIPPRRTGLATGSNQPGRVGQARCSRSPVRLHGPVYPEPSPRTSPPVAAPHTRLPEPSVSQELPESPVTPVLPESPACPVLPESPVHSGSIARVPSQRLAARVTARKRPQRRLRRRTKTMVEWGPRSGLFVCRVLFFVSVFILY